MTSDKSLQTYILLGSKVWSKSVFESELELLPGSWYFISSLEEFNIKKIKEINPRYIFFLHWSWKVPASIIHEYECVCFHMTDVPYGRGGSPLQNLILREHQITKLTALRMTYEFDAGPVYCKEELGLGGNAEAIYLRATRLSIKMIQRIVTEKPVPVPQTGEVTVFRRRIPAESQVTEAQSLERFYDHIRMLDAEGYPKAFIEYQGFRLEFSRAALYNGRIVADVVITPIEETNP